MKATYSGDANFASSSDTGKLTVIRKPTAEIDLGCVDTKNEVGTPCGFISTALSSDEIPVGTLTFSSRNGTFSPNTCTIEKFTEGEVPFSQCSVQYVPKTLGSGSKRSDTVTAVYSGDDRYSPASYYTKVTVTERPPAPELFLKCEDTKDGNSTPCGIILNTTYTDSFSGTLTFSGRNGTFDSNTCTVHEFSASVVRLALCSVNYIPKSLGGTKRSDTVTAVYSGNDSYSPATYTAKLDVTSRLPAPDLELKCNSTRAGDPTSCGFTKDTTYIDNFPTGNLTFTGFKGTFNSNTCPIVEIGASVVRLAFCTVEYTPGGTNARTDKLTATYSGDSNYSPGTFTTTVDVTKSG